ncbi:MAG: MarR family winged helix-turn-helix transcriptional regulator [Microbacterium sp.]|uniref:MarR family winged helix-turn-helix transcriptional regulator n=1 Tax=Microbacterium sp. TaxID=51671 RepID=UPI00262E42D4|nr:MarR family winged helix-turn-helix transcriptional regulator [Microbacterium sp.]MCX6502996.1 MarR family winged helix-turn-helix transcriptional regulator [Microbacterium sp.]
MTITQLGIAVHLDELGHMSGSDLARRFRITPQSASTALAALEARGWVTRLRHPFHGRVIWYEVTDVGRAGAHEGRRRLGILQEQFAELLGADSMRATIDRLQEIPAVLDGPEPPATMWPA